MLTLEEVGLAAHGILVGQVSLLIWSKLLGTRSDWLSEAVPTLLMM